MFDRGDLLFWVGHLVFFFSIVFSFLVFFVIGCKVLGRLAYSAYI